MSDTELTQQETAKVVPPVEDDKVDEPTSDTKSTKKKDAPQSMRQRTGLHIQPTLARRTIRHETFKPAKRAKPASGAKAEGKHAKSDKPRMAKHAARALAAFAEAAMRRITLEGYARVAAADTYTLKPLHFAEAVALNPSLRRLCPGHFVVERKEVKRQKKDDAGEEKAPKVKAAAPKAKAAVPKAVKKVPLDGKISAGFDIEMAEGGKIELVTS